MRQGRVLERHHAKVRVGIVNNHGESMPPISYIYRVCRPAAVAWAIAFVVVYTIYLKFRRITVLQRPSHEWHEFLPFFAYGYSPVEIVLSDLRNRFLASRNHARPSSVQHRMRHTVGDVSVCDFFDRALLTGHHASVGLGHTHPSANRTEYLMGRTSPEILASLLHDHNV